MVRNRLRNISGVRGKDQLVIKIENKCFFYKIRLKAWQLAAAFIETPPIHQLTEKTKIIRNQSEQWKEMSVMLIWWHSDAEMLPTWGDHQGENPGWSSEYLCITMLTAHLQIITPAITDYTTKVQQRQVVNTTLTYQYQLLLLILLIIVVAQHKAYYSTSLVAYMYVYVSLMILFIPVLPILSLDWLAKSD